MKYLKKYESYNKPFEKISNSEYKGISNKLEDFTEQEINVIDQTFKDLKMLFFKEKMYSCTYKYKIALKGGDFDSFLLIKREDEYFYVVVNPLDLASLKNDIYKCDQIFGLVEFIKFYKDKIRKQYLGYECYLDEDINESESEDKLKFPDPYVVVPSIELSKEGALDFTDEEKGTIFTEIKKLDPKDTWYKKDMKMVDPYTFEVKPAGKDILAYEDRLGMGMFSIVKRVDDYYYLSTRGRVNYKCDGMDGLLKCIRYYIEKINQLERVNENLENKGYEMIEDIDEFNDKNTMLRFRLDDIKKIDKIFLNKNIISSYSGDLQFHRESGTTSYLLYELRHPSDYSHILTEFAINVYDDEWYIVCLAINLRGIFKLTTGADVSAGYNLFYKCDQLDGLAKLVEDYTTWVRTITPEDVRSGNLPWRNNLVKESNQELLNIPEQGFKLASANELNKMDSLFKKVSFLEGEKSKLIDRLPDHICDEGDFMESDDILPAPSFIRFIKSIHSNIGRCIEIHISKREDDYYIIIVDFYPKLILADKYGMDAVNGLYLTRMVHTDYYICDGLNGLLNLVEHIKKQVSEIDIDDSGKIKTAILPWTKVKID